MPVNPQELQVVSKAAGDVKAFLDLLKAEGVTSPAIDEADVVAGAVQAAFANGTFDPLPLIPLEVAQLNALKAKVTSPVIQRLLDLLANALGKLVPAQPAS